jgi:glycosyltransferase involved in cell wall biosynthesis
MHVTSGLEEAEMRALGLTLPDIHCVANGVDSPTSHPALSAGPFAGITHPYALFLGRLNWKKGLDRLIDAWAMVPDLHLIVAGNDEENYLPQLKARVVQLGVGDRISFVGPASESEKWALYENAEMFILPSYSENFGNTVAEAMAMACPVVVTPEVGLADFVRSAGAGVVTSGDPDKLAATVRTLQSDAIRRRQMGCKGQQAVIDKLSWSAVAEKLDAIYSRAVSNADPWPEARFVG